MAEPVFIHTYNEEAERGVPVTDEDVARGFLEEGWVPTFEFGDDNGDMTARMPTDAPTGLLRFFESTWFVARLPSGTWVIHIFLFVARALKTRLPIADDEELITEPCAIEDIHVGTVMLCKLPESSTGHIIVCYAITEYGKHVRLLGRSGGNTTMPNYDYFRVCKQPCVPFVLK